MHKIAIFLSTVVCITILVSCSRKIPQDGFVEFGVEGKKYRIEGREFVIRIAPVFPSEKEFKVIPRGAKNIFEFFIRATESRSKEEMKVIGRDLELGAKGKIPEGKDFYTFDAAWRAETTDPEGVLKSKITLQNQNLGLTHFIIIINVPGRHISNPPEVRHNSWVEIDEISEDRVKGRFGGPFEMNLMGKEADEKFELHQKGEINKESLMSEIEKEIQITDGVFDMPLRKLFKYK